MFLKNILAELTIVNGLLVIMKNVFLLLTFLSIAAVLIITFKQSFPSNQQIVVVPRMQTDKHKYLSPSDKVV